jgi:hypothetical protein
VTLYVLDLCHQCDRPIAAGIFCQLCINSAQASAVPASYSSPTRRGDVVAVLAPRPAGTADGSAGSTRADCRGSQPARGSAVIPGAPATTRNENTRRSRGLQAAPTGA